MIITQNKWLVIRENFSQEEKDQLGESMVGESICPKGMIIETSKLSIELRDKLGKVLLDAMNK